MGLTRPAAYAAGLQSVNRSCFNENRHCEGRRPVAIRIP